MASVTGAVIANISVSVSADSESSALLRLHDSLIQNILRRTDIQSRVAASVACRRLARVSAEHPPSVVDLSSDGVHPEACRQFIERAKGAVITLISARHQHRTACDAASARRFSTGVRCTQVVPYTAGPAALRLASSLPSLQHLALHEATSCLGGMTDEFAAAVAAHCPLLASLEVAFTRYSLPSEFFSDAGMMALAAGCPRLSCLSLTNCGAITNRSLYAVAVHCRGLRSLALGGYHELITDYGTVVLFQACSSLSRVVLSGKLRRVTDESVEALAANSGGALQEVKLTSSMGDRSLAALAAHCGALRLVDCGKCEPSAISALGLASLLAAVSAQPVARPRAAEPHRAHLSSYVGSYVVGGSGLDSGGGLDYIGCGLDSGGGRSPMSPAVLRVLLPRGGVTAAEVVRLGPSGEVGGGGAAARCWRAVCPPAAPSLPLHAWPPSAPAAYTCGGGAAPATPTAPAPVTAAASVGSSGRCAAPAKVACEEVRVQL